MIWDKKNKKQKNQKHKRRKGAPWTALLMTLVILMSVGCGSFGSGKNAGNSDGSSAGSSGSEALQDVNVIPEDGVITKEQFQTVAGQDRQIRFTGETADGISYVWIYDASKIQNPEDQNLKVDFTSEGLDDVKTEASHANDALKMTMHGKGVICAPVLEVTLPVAWQSNKGLLVKEQGGKLARMSDVTIVSKAKKTDKKAKDGQEASDGEEASGRQSSDPMKGSTVLNMNVTSLDGDCYVVGGIVHVQNDGAANANVDGNENGTAAAAGGNDVQTGDAGSSGGGSTTGSQTSGSGGKSKAGGSSGDVANGDVAGDGGSGQALTCTISISCSAILGHMDSLTPGKEEFVPADGQILAPSTVEFEEGDSVYDVLIKACRQAGIHTEASFTPMYGSTYVEGINQLYEFDCGDLSGWMYNVNGWFPNYGCDKYTLSDGDVINWVYTCDLGKDVGGEGALG